MFEEHYQETEKMCADSENEHFVEWHSKEEAEFRARLLAEEIARWESPEAQADRVETAKDIYDSRAKKVSREMATDPEHLGKGAHPKKITRVANSLLNHHKVVADATAKMEEWKKSHSRPTAEVYVGYFESRSATVGFRVR
jgi:hypothetical protein